MRVCVVETVSVETVGVEFVVVRVHTRRASDSTVQVDFADPEDASDMPFAFCLDLPLNVQSFAVGQRVRFAMVVE